MDYPSTHKSLLERVQNGEEVAWREFYDRYAPVIRFVGSLYHFNEFECEDLVQNVMLKFFDSRKKFVYREKQTKFRTWFAAVIRSQAVDYIRKAGRGMENPLPEDDSLTFTRHFYHISRGLEIESESYSGVSPNPSDESVLCRIFYFSSTGGMMHSSSGA